MRTPALAALFTLAASAAAGAEPCPLFGLESKPLRSDVIASPEGGIVVGELPAVSRRGDDKTPERSAWKVQVKGKQVERKEDPIAPGLVVVRPPSGATAYELLGADGKKSAAAKITTRLPALLDAPLVRKVVASTTPTRHPTTFVNVELSDEPPDDAIALVLSRQKGPAMSWGRVLVQAKNVLVYSTQGGCVTAFPAGTLLAQPGDLVTLFWVDAYGRRSRVSKVIVVEKL